MTCGLVGGRKVVAAAAESLALDGMALVVAGGGGRVQLCRVLRALLPLAREGEGERAVHPRSGRGFAAALLLLLPPLRPLQRGQVRLPQFLRQMAYLQSPIRGC